jgi:hypothetical protein
VPPSSDLRPALKPPQFSLRSLLLLVTICAVVFSLVNVLPPMAIAGLVFLIVSVFAHIAGNAIGTRLRENGSQPVDAGDTPTREVQDKGPAPRCAPQTRLSQRQSLGWPAFAATGAGLLFGGSGGGIWTFRIGGADVAELSIIVAIVSFAVLGGFAAFLAFSFAQVGLSALRQALGSSRASADDAGS